MLKTIRGLSSVPLYDQRSLALADLQSEQSNMKTLLFVLAVTVATVAAHPDRERRSVLGLPVLAPGTAVLGHALGGAVVTAPAHGTTVVAGPTGAVVSAVHPWGHAVVVPGVWG